MVLCQICNKEEATVHVTKIVNDNMTSEAHYCAPCATKHINIPKDSLQNQNPDKILKKLDNLDRIQTIQQIAEKYPDDPIVLYGLGEAYFSVEQYDDAIQTFQKIIQLKADYTAAYRELGKALAMAGKIEEAKEIYKKGMDVAQQTGELQTGKEMRVFLIRLEKVH